MNIPADHGNQANGLKHLRESADAAVAVTAPQSPRQRGCPAPCRGAPQTEACGAVSFETAEGRPASEATEPKRPPMLQAIMDELDAA